MKYLIMIIVSLFCAYIVNKLYLISTDWKFTIAFLGGAITMVVVLPLINYKSLKSK